MARKVRRTCRYPYEPDYAVPPGATLRETIEAHGIDQKEFARRTRFTEKHVNQVIKGKAPISADAAIRFERVTGVPAQFWNNLESQYQEQMARLAATEQLQADLAWLKNVPIKELTNRGAIPASKEPTELLEHVLQFFGVASVAAWKEGWSEPQFAFRRSQAVAQQDEAMAAWLRLGEIAARKQECASYSAKRFRANLNKVRSLTVCDPEEFVPKMTKLCAESGVALVFVREIKGAPVSGATKWLTPGKAMICLSLRGKQNDRLWFTFFHEAGHILNDSKKEVFVDVDDGDNPRERAANEFAARLLIPPQYDPELPALTSRAAVIAFARKLRIHPGIVVGRLQREEILPYSHLNDLKDRFEWGED